MRIIFCGTPAIAVPTLLALTKIAEVPGVVCQPDRPSGRGMQLTPPAVKSAAEQLGLPVYQPQKVRDGTLARWMRELEADAALVIAYGRILDREVLSAPRLGCVNLHASLLPQYRGAAPIQRALMNGETKTGVCLMQMDEGMDTGAVLARHDLAIAWDDTAGTLSEKLGELAAQVTLTELPRFFQGELRAEPQNHAAATHAPPLTKDDETIRWSEPAHRLINQVRGLAPRPGASTWLLGSKPRRLKVLRLQPHSDVPALEPGEVSVIQGRLVVGTGAGTVLLGEGQVEGKKAQTGEELLRGRALQVGDRLGVIA